jgi:hypothetical protein
MWSTCNSFDFSWSLVTIHDSSTTNVLIYNLFPAPIAHPLQEEKALEEEADRPPSVVEGPPPPVVGRQRVKVYIDPKTKIADYG